MIGDLVKDAPRAKRRLLSAAAIGTGISLILLKVDMAYNHMKIQQRMDMQDIKIEYQLRADSMPQYEFEICEREVEGIREVYPC